MLNCEGPEPTRHAGFAAPSSKAWQGAGSRYLHRAPGSCRHFPGKSWLCSHCLRHEGSLFLEPLKTAEEEGDRKPRARSLLFLNSTFYYKRPLVVTSLQLPSRLCRLPREAACSAKPFPTFPT
uniref:Uncharacterized protein n=1 Tax=Dromaius novaehollandiae TaxID=8790 RepID=A0A8C4JM30_DRONO